MVSFFSDLLKGVGIVFPVAAIGNLLAANAIAGAGIPVISPGAGRLVSDVLGTRRVSSSPSHPLLSLSSGSLQNLEMSVNNAVFQPSPFQSGSYLDELYGFQPVTISPDQLRAIEEESWLTGAGSISVALPTSPASSIPLEQRILGDLTSVASLVTYLA